MTVIEQLATLDFATIDDALGRVRTAVDVDGELDLGSLDVGSLLGDLGPLIETVEQIDNDPEAMLVLARSVLDDLGAMFDLPDVAELGELVEAIAALTDLMTGVVDVLTSGDGHELVDRLLTEVGQSLDLSTLIADVVGRSADALGFDVPDVLEDALDQLARLGGGIDDPAVLAEVVLRSIGGFDLGAISALAVGLSGSLSIVAGAGDHSRVAGLLVSLDVEIDAAIAAAGPADDLEIETLVGAVEQVSDTLDLLASTELPRLVNGVAADLRSARNQLTDLDLASSLDDLRAHLPERGIDSLEVLVGPLREIAAALDTVTSGSITAGLAEARGELTKFATEGPLGDLLDGIERGQQLVVRQIRALPLEEVRDTVVTALRELQNEILTFRGFDVLDEIVAPIRALVPPLQELDTSSVENAVDELVAMVNGVFSDFPIEQLRDAVDEVVDPLGEIIDEATPLIEGIADELEALVVQIDAIDFDAAGAQVLEALSAIRSEVQGALDGGQVPDALKAVIAGVASTLKAMDLGVELSEPFEAAMAEIDVGALLEPIEELWSDLGAALERVTPEALIGELDPPFDDLLAKLDDISLAPLTDALSDVFDRLLGAIRSADPRTLIAPLEAEFQQLLATLRGLLDPAPLFAPLRHAYDELHGSLSSIDVEAAMNEVLGGISDSPTMLTEAVGQELGRRAEGGAALPEATDELFRFGDIIRPLAALVAEIRGRLHGLGRDVVGEGLGLVADATRTLRSLLDPADGMATRLAAALDERRGWFDATAGDGPLAATRARLVGLQSALDGLTLEAAARARLDAAIGPVRLEARVELEASVTAPALDEAGRVDAAASPGGVGRSIRLLTRALDELLPGPLLDELVDPREEVAGFIDALIDPLDPAPLVQELDQIGEQISTTLAGFVDELSVGLLDLWDELIAGMQPLMPTSLAARLQAVVTAVAEELTALDPGVIEVEARQVVDVAVDLLALHSPATVAEELGDVFDVAVAIVEELDPADLLGDLDPFAGLRSDLELLRPSVVLAPLVERTAALTDALELVASIDLDIAGELVARLEAAFSSVLEGVEREWDGLLDELSGLAGGASTSVSVGT